MTSDPPIVRSVWKSGADFLEHYTEADPPRIFCLVAADRELPPGLSVGTMVSVVVVLEERGTEFHLHARVLDRRKGTEKRGVTLELLREERDRIELLLVAARGESIPYFKRRYERIPCRVPCEIVTETGARLSGETTNVNEGGLHARVEPVPRRDEEVLVDVTLPGDRRWRIRARVVDVLAEGPQRGVGLEFLFASAEQRDEVRQDVAALRARAPAS